MCNILLGNELFSFGLIKYVWKLINMENVLVPTSYFTSFTDAWFVLICKIFVISSFFVAFKLFFKKDILFTINYVSRMENGTNEASKAIRSETVERYCTTWDQELKLLQENMMERFTRT